MPAQAEVPTPVQAELDVSAQPEKTEEVSEAPAKPVEEKAQAVEAEKKVEVPVDENSATEGEKPARPRRPRGRPPKKANTATEQ